jgi:APA family basic amino acid/polyamine antiporter
VPHYLTPIWGGFTEAGGEIATAGLVIAGIAALNVVGFTGLSARRLLTVLAIAGVGLTVAVIAAGLATSWDPAALTGRLDLFTSPGFDDIVYAAVVATVAYAGIEAAANLAPELDFRPSDLRRLVTRGAVLAPVLYAGVAAVALMAVPVVATPAGPETPLGSTHIEDPLLGVVQSYEPGWVGGILEVAVVAVAPLALVWAAANAMLGLSRHVYVLATNRQIPSWLGKLDGRFRTPKLAILIAAAFAFGLVLPLDVALLGGIFAFGATIAFTIAHLSIIRLRTTEPRRERPFSVPWTVTIRGAPVPLPALCAAVVTALAWLSVVIYHDEARWVGIAWMAVGLVAYVIYRKGVEGTSLTRRVEVPEEALVKVAPRAEYASILVPVFGTPLDDDIVGTAGRLADAADLEGNRAPRLAIVYVLELPLRVPLDSPPPPEMVAIADRALDRAKDVGDEYEAVEVDTAMVRARSQGAGIVQAARERGAEAIVMGAEPPTQVRGGAVLGGRGGSRPAEIGPVTEYVLRKAPCPVLITAPPDIAVDGATTFAQPGATARRN